MAKNEVITEQEAEILGFLRSSNKAKAYVNAAVKALDAAETPGEIMRIQRMLKMKLRALQSAEYLADRN